MRETHQQQRAGKVGEVRYQVALDQLWHGRLSALAPET
jgi:hypothetical protein